MGGQGTEGHLAEVIVRNFSHVSSVFGMHLYCNSLTPRDPGHQLRLGTDPTAHGERDDEQFALFLFHPRVVLLDGA